MAPRKGPRVETVEEKGVPYLLDHSAKVAYHFGTRDASEAARKRFTPGELAKNFDPVPSTYAYLKKEPTE